MKKTFGYPAGAWVGLAVLCPGAAVTLLNMAVLSPLLRRFDPIAVLSIVLAAAGAALLLTGIVVTTVPAALLAAIIVLNGTSSAYITGIALLLDGDASHPGAVMSIASAFVGGGAALGPLVAGWALAASGSFETAYRALGLLAPVAIIALWAGTRRRARAPVVRRA